jgi:hypothetical protein
MGEPSMDTPTNETPLSLYAFERLWMTGSSALHGSQKMDQKNISTPFPESRVVYILKLLPEMSPTSNSGAWSPTFSISMPLIMGMGVKSSRAKTDPTPTVTDENISRMTKIFGKTQEINERLI